MDTKRMDELRGSISGKETERIANDKVFLVIVIERKE